MLPLIFKKILRRITGGKTPPGADFNELLLALPQTMANAKVMAFEIARLKRAVEGVKPVHPQLRHYGLTSKLCTAADIESGWSAYWLDQLKLPLNFYHRKSWELSFVLQAIHEAVLNFEGKQGLGFACGREKIPAYLAARGAKILATDAPASVEARDAWVKTDQHASGKDSLFYSDVVSREVFDARMDFEFADMNDIPSAYGNQFDFCWSICAVEHLGTIAKGLQFMENSLAVLKPGGVAVHTIEFNLDDGPTVDNWPCVLFQKKHIQELSNRVKRAGGTLLGPDFDEGLSYYDKYVDTPPYYTMSNEIHLKLHVDGFRCTCLGVILRKNPAAGRPNGVS